MIRFSALVPAVCVAIAAAAVCGLDAIPLGWPGEWTWNRHSRWPEWQRWVLPVAATLAYAALLAWLVGRRQANPGRKAAWPLIAILGAGAAMQACWLDLPAPPRGIERWAISIVHPASSGYFETARMIEIGPFLRQYERFVSEADVFHIGTHPPGLFIAYAAALEWCRTHPSWAEILTRAAPERFRMGLQAGAEIRAGPLARRRGLDGAEAATVALMAWLTWVSALVAALPIYLLARQSASQASALAAAGLWLMAPAILLFLPTGDCIYPLLAVVSVLLLHTGWRTGVSALAFPAGIVWWLGMFTSLAFLAVAPLLFGPLAFHAMIEHCKGNGSSGGRLARHALWFGLGALLPVVGLWLAFDLRLIEVWRINLAKHAGFYRAMPRSYLPWLWINAIEYVMAIGPAAAGLIATALVSIFASRGREDDASSQAGGWRAASLWGRLGFAFLLLTLAALDVSGRNRSEAARLWIFTIPFAFAWTAWAIDGVRQSRRLTFCLALLSGLAALILIARIEPLLPVAIDG